MTPSGRPLLHSVGHSNHEAGKFVALLKQHNIDTLIDVRSAPYSRYCPQFNRPALEQLMTGVGIQYVYLGDKLGGMPKGDAFRDESGALRYEVVLAAPFFVEGIRRLVGLLPGRRCAMMCAEENPQHCHRHKLVEPALIAASIDICHIRGDGRIEASDTLDEPEDLTQLRLF